MPTDHSANHAGTFVFREVASLDELAQASSLRFETYSRLSSLAKLLHSDAGIRLDLDAYDLVSRHFVLLERRGPGRERVVGVVRIVDNREAPTASLVRDLAARSPSLAARVAERRTAPLPLLSFLEQASQLVPTFERWAAAGERIAEPGRLAIHPRARSTAARNRVRLSSFMIAGAQAVGWHQMQLDRVLMDCNVTLSPIYRPFGFHAVPGDEPRFQPRLGITMEALQATPDSLPLAHRPLVEALARQLREQNEMVLDPGSPVFDGIRTHGAALAA